MIAAKKYFLNAPFAKVGDNRMNVSLTFSSYETNS